MKSLSALLESPFNLPIQFDFVSHFLSLLFTPLLIDRDSLRLSSALVLSREMPMYGFLLIYLVQHLSRLKTLDLQTLPLDASLGGMLDFFSRRFEWGFNFVW